MEARETPPKMLSPTTVTSSSAIPVTTINTPTNTFPVSKPENTPPRETSSMDKPESNTTIIEPKVGRKVGHAKRSKLPARGRTDWDEVEDPERYTLPPVDHNLYDLQNSQSSKDKYDPIPLSWDKLIDPKPTTRSKSKSPASRRRHLKLKEVIVGEHPPKKAPIQTYDTLDEDLYNRRGCWCKDCPWLIAYAIYALIWLILMGIIWKKGSFIGENHISLKDSKCILLCAELVAPARPLDVEKTSTPNFHCIENVDKWEKDVFRPWRSIIDPNGNPNCVRDCNRFPSEDSFLASCVKFEEKKGSKGRSGIFEPGNALVYVDSIRGHWYWIVHVILITNAVSLFILLVPLFFCCPMIAFFVVASVLLSLTLTIMLWWELGRYIGRENSARLDTPTSVGTKWIFTIASTLFSCYVIFNAFIIFKRFRITCAIAGLASRAVNHVPMILLESILTMILLFLLIALIIFVSLEIESSTTLIVTGTEYYYESSPFLWFVRIYTLIFGYWTAQLLINCQTIIIHGAMTRYYFEKNSKNKVLKSHKRLLQYHICTACFAGLLFNWFYWIRWVRKKSRIRSRSLFGTGAFGLSFCPASKAVKNFVYTEPSVTRRIDKANPYFFLVHILVVMIIGIVCHLVFRGAYSSALWPEFLMFCYSYFVSMSAVNIYRVTKDAMFLCYVQDKIQTKANPARNMKMPHPVSVFFGYEPRVVPR